MNFGSFRIHWMDGISVGTIAATILGWLPHVATALAIGWYAALFYDRWKAKKKAESAENKAG